jgi:hypothetical protein
MALGTLILLLVFGIIVMIRKVVEGDDEWDDQEPHWT